MSIQSASIPVGGTYAATGGTATGLLVRKDSASKVESILDNNAEFINQVNVDFLITEPKTKADAPNGYTQMRNQVYFKVPLALDNGKRTHNTLDIRISADVETTAAELATLREYAMHVLADADFQNFWDKQALV